MSDSQPPTRTDRSAVYKAVLDNLADLVAVYDQNLNVLYINPAMEGVLGYKRSEIVNKRTGDFAPPEDRAKVLEFGKKILANPGVRLTNPARLVHRDGTIREIDSVAINLLQDPEVRGIIVTSRDVTEARRAARSLKVSEQKYQNLIENVTEGIYEVDLIGTFTFINPAFCGILDRPHTELIGASYRSITDEATARELYAKFNEVYDTGHPNSGFTYALLNAAGDRRMVEGSMSLIRDAEGRASGFRGAVRDVTERIAANQTLVERTRQLERVNQDLTRKNAELDEFTYIASHDLQEPVRKLIAFSQFLKKDMGEALPPRAAKDLGFIVDAAQRMQRLISDLLALSRAGKSEIKRDLIPLGACVDLALEALSIRIEAAGASIRRDPLPGVWGDRTLITQLYLNLIGNALKFRGERPPEIELTSEPGEDGDPILSVRDNGIGIDPAYAEQVFAPFKRLHSREKFEGSGIGLAICRKCVERHGGRIWVESVPGGGSNFKFTLPERHGSRERG